MKKLNRFWHKDSGPRTIWTKGGVEGIPKRFQFLITVVMPLHYILITLFGIFVAIFPLETFSIFIGPVFSSIWAILLALFGILSFISLVLRSKAEMYTSIVVTFLLSVYPFYLIFLTVYESIMDHDLGRIALIFAITIYLIMPAWRVIDIVLELRKTQQRQLYAEFALGETHHDTDRNN